MLERVERHVFAFLRWCAEPVPGARPVRRGRPYAELSDRAVASELKGCLRIRCSGARLRASRTQLSPTTPRSWRGCASCRRGISCCSSAAPVPKPQRCGDIDLRGARERQGPRPEADADRSGARSARMKVTPLGAFLGRSRVRGCADGRGEQGSGEDLHDRLDEAIMTRRAYAHGRRVSATAHRDARSGGGRSHPDR